MRKRVEHIQKWSLLPYSMVTKKVYVWIKNTELHMLTFLKNKLFPRSSLKVRGRERATGKVDEIYVMYFPL